MAAIVSCTCDDGGASVKERNNDQWLADLRGPKKDETLADLRILLVCGLRAALHGRTSGVGPSIENFVQEALIKILNNLNFLRGEPLYHLDAEDLRAHGLRRDATQQVARRLPGGGDRLPGGERQHVDRPRTGGNQGNDSGRLPALHRRGADGQATH